MNGKFENLDQHYKTIRKIVCVHRILLVVNIVAVLLCLFAGIYWFAGAAFFSIFSWVCYRGGCEGDIKGIESVKNGLNTLLAGWLKLLVVIMIFVIGYFGLK